jgi:hypothetical protein
MPEVVSHFACGRQRRILLKSKAGRILANDRARWFDVVRRSDLNLVKWKYQLRSFNVRQDFGQRQGLRHFNACHSRTGRKAHPLRAEQNYR